MCTVNPEIYIYKCVYDDGTAPCVDDGLFSLTICKPAIRRKAPEGSLIFAFGGNRENPPNRLVYIAQVTERVEDGRYFVLRKFRRRQDCIYTKMKSGRFVHRGSGWTHDCRDNLTTDIGKSAKNAVALLSDDFRYFGEEGTEHWKRAAPMLKRLLELKLTQGHRVVKGEGLRNELLALKESIWRKHTTRKVLGEPMHGYSENHCKPMGRTKSC